MYLILVERREKEEQFYCQDEMTARNLIEQLKFQYGDIMYSEIYKIIDTVF